MESLQTVTKDLVAFLESEVGEGLRAVISYTPDDADVRYLREDLREQVNLDDFEPSIAQARELHTQLNTVGLLQGDTLGSPVGNVSIFEQTIVMILTADETNGVIVTLERNIGRQVADFVERCTSVMNEGS